VYMFMYSRSLLNVIYKCPFGFFHLFFQIMFKLLILCHSKPILLGLWSITPLSTIFQLYGHFFLDNRLLRICPVKTCETTNMKDLIDVFYILTMRNYEKRFDCRLLVASGFISVQYIEYRSNKGVNTLVFVN
jgi:hypothetical protein